MLQLQRPANLLDSLPCQAVTVSGLPEAAGATDADRMTSQNEAIVQAFIFVRERDKDLEHTDVLKEHQLTYIATTGDTNHRYIDIHVSRSLLTNTVTI